MDNALELVNIRNPVSVGAEQQFIVKLWILKLCDTLNMLPIVEGCIQSHGQLRDLTISSTFIQTVSLNLVFLLRHLF